MTNTQVTDLVASNPAVIEKYTKIVNGVPQPPQSAALKTLAEAELQNELNSLLNDPAIRGHVLERTESFSTSGTTSEGRGDILTLNNNVGSVISVTSSDTQLPIKKIGGKEDFDYWYGEHYNATYAPDSPDVWVPWDPNPQGVPRILFSPGIGSASTVKVSYVRRVAQPVSMSILPDDVHYLVVTGVLNRMTGGAFEFSYERERKNVIGRLNRSIGSVSAMRLDDEQRIGNLRLSAMTGGNEGYWTDPNHARPY